MKNIPVFLSLVFILFGFGLSAQNLIVSLTNNTTSTYPISEIQSIKFGTNSMTLYKLNGTINTWSIDDIDHYAFESTSNVKDEVNSVNDKLTIFPNPASEKVNIEYSTNFKGNITIDIIDANGKQIKHIYQGSQKGVIKYVWNTNVQSGIYYCRIVTENKTLTKKIIIH